MPSPEPEARGGGSTTGGAAILERVRRQVALGPRYPGSPGHEGLRRLLREELERECPRVVSQGFSVTLPEGPAACENLVGVFPAARAAQGRGGPLLLGTHFDTRMRADREPDLARVESPIPGANDGGSGTAVLLHLLPFLRRRRFVCDIMVAFFDAEDVGGICGNPFSVGARRFVAEPPLELPERALVLDMVGGAGLRLDVDAHILHHPPSYWFTRELFSLGREREERVFSAFGRQRITPEKLRYVVCDHFPFLAAGIAACLFIDLDYPPWHTQGDLPEAMSAESLATIAGVVERYLLRLAP